MEMQTPYKPINKIRIVTAASLFDGHDAAINIMRRIIQATGAEVIHLGHDRSVEEVVNCAIQEDAQAIAMTSYQGGHVEYLKYMYDLLKEKGANHIKIFAGGGGTILPSEIKELQVLYQKYIKRVKMKLKKRDQKYDEKGTQRESQGILDQETLEIEKNSDGQPDETDLVEINLNGIKKIKV